MFLSIKKLMARFRTWLNLPHGTQVSSPSALYHSCSELPLDRFITCIVDNNIRAIIKHGEPAQEDIVEAWANIYAEYIDLNKDNEGAYLRDLQKSIVLLKSELEIIDSIFVSLSMVYSRKLHEHLEKEYEIYVTFTGDTQKDIKTLESARNSLAPMRLELETKEKEYEEYIKSRSNDTITRDYFNRMLRALARFNRVVTIRAKDITVEEFIYMIQDLIESTKKIANADAWEDN